MSAPNSLPPQEASKKSRLFFRRHRDVFGLVFWLLLTLRIGFGIGAGWADTFFHTLKLSTWEATIAILIATAVALMIVGSRVLVNAAVIVCYPAVISVRLLPGLISKFWPLLLVSLPGIRVMATSFRIRAAKIVIGVAAATICLYANSTILLNTGAALLIVLLAWHFAERFQSAYNPKTVYFEISEFLKWAAEKMPQPLKIRDSMVDAARQQKSQSETAEGKNKASALNEQASSLLVFYSVSVILQKVAEKMDGIRKSRMFDIYLFVSFVVSSFFVVATFGFVFIAVLRLSPQQFESSRGLGIADMFELSLCNALTSDVSGITIVGQLARRVAILETVFSVGVIGIILSALFTSLRERHNDDLSLVCAQLRRGAEQLGKFFERDLSLTHRAVEQILIFYAPDITKLLLNAKYGKHQGSSLFDTLKSEVKDANEIEQRAAGLQSIRTVEIDNFSPGAHRRETGRKKRSAAPRRRSTLGQEVQAKL